MLFPFLLAVAGLLAGGVAALAGFGVGSLLTPVLAISAGTKLAVALVAIPHFFGSILRVWILRRHIDRRVFVRFGITSAVGGLLGALAHVVFSSAALTVVFGALLLLAAVSEFTGWISRVHWGRSAAWGAGAISGVLGGLVGNQGSIRSAALLGF